MAMTVRLTEEQTESLRATAEREGISMHAAAVRAIEEYTGRRVGRDEWVRRIVEEDSAVLRRLDDA